METSLNHSLIHLGAGELLSVESGRGRCLVVFSGKVWITQEGDIGDYIIDAGESFTFDRDGMALVEALQPARMALLGGPADAADAIGYEAAWLNTEPSPAAPAPAMQRLRVVDAEFEQDERQAA